MKDHKPLVSVIIAVRNGERFVGSAIESVLAQDYRPYEIIVVDGQSTDRTAEIAQSYGAVRYVLQTGRGVADAYNIGVDAAKGELVAFLSSDDLWTPDKLTVQVGYMLDHPELMYTIARITVFLDPGCAVPPSFRRELLEGDHVGKVMETVVARKAVFDAIGGFDTSLPVSEDADWFVRTHDHNIPMAVIPRVLLHKRVHDANLTWSTPTPDLHAHLLKALRGSVRRKQNMPGVPAE